ncbi:hydroxyacid dehydrogenase [Bradyrhizobium prioriisuperbiae]|uniref:hydroxyacid dehydrogenase n=1 Tax=Bradyrhizobium prioriisuperbiae TaxID=2854389 RepID=UPI0028E2B845|nr:hydroxyacid dehydrogenase [Bradyrhizobium prioritasuperba]
MKILLTHIPQARGQYYGARALAALREMADVRLHEASESLAPAQLVAAAAGIDVIVADRLTAAPAEVFQALPELKAFCRVAVDIRNIDVAAASAAGVLVTRAKPGFMTAVAELGLGFMIDLARGISRATGDYHAGRKPEIRMGRELAGATVGIIGYGAISRILAPMVSSLGMNVLVTDPYVSIDDEGVEQVALDDLLARSDYVVCLAVATAETENLIDAAALARMRADACFINLSRGNLVDEAALADALRAGRIAGAAMDVGRAADQMPSPDLAALPNVIATPHIGGLTPEAVESQAFDTVRQVQALSRGEVPEGAVNAQAWTRRRG